MRRPTAGYYTHSENRLERQLGDLFDDVADRSLVPSLAVAPHGSLQESGRVAAAVYDAIDFSQFRNVVILGAKHRDIGPDCAVSTDTWRTPLGTVDVDRTFVDQLLVKDIVGRSERAHSHETSIEMQLLFLQYAWHDFDFAPVLIDNDISREKHEEVIDALEAALNPSDLLIVGTDLIHHGYGSYEEEADDREDLVIQRDSEIIDSLEETDIDAVAEKGRQYHVCGWRPLVMGMEIGRTDVCHVLGHTTNFSSATDNDTVIGYGGLCYT